MLSSLRLGGLRMSSLRLPNAAVAPLLSPSLKPSRRRRRRHASKLFTTSCWGVQPKKKGERQKVVVISGPTGAGKSRLALELAKRLNGEIISADSVQVYRGLDIGSAKPSFSERREVPHHLVDILHPSEDYSVGQFYEDARQITKEVLSRGCVPVVTGGTGLYLRWYIYGKPDVPKASPEITYQVHSELADFQRDGDWDAAVQLVIKAGDPGVQSLAANDWYRLRRRLEILKLSGAPPSAFQVPYNSFKKKFESSEVDASDINCSTAELQERKSKGLDYDFICFFLTTQRLDLYKSIDFRCEDMLLDYGILSEAKWLLDLGLMPNSNSATRAIGYRQAMDFLLMTKEQGGWISSKDFHNFLSEFQKASRNFAKRQLTWFRNEPMYQWIDASKPLVKGYAAEEQLGHALEGSDVVIIPAGVPRKPGMTRDDLFKINAGIVKSLCEAIAKYCPNALVNMISNPVNSTVPIAAEVFKSKGVYDERKLFGVTTLDVVRAKTFYAGKAEVHVADVNVPVIGGHAGITILPLFSQATPKANLSDVDIKALTKRTQNGGTEVVEAKAGKGSATVSMAYAGAIFADACLKGLNGVPDVVEFSFVQSTVTELPFFASKVRLGKNGVEEVLGLGPLSDYEQRGLEGLKPELKSSIEKGIAFVRDN